MRSLDIVIPCLNEEHYIADTLRAISDEFHGMPNLKVYVVDNGSTDSTKEVVEKLQHELPISISKIDCPRRGVSRARNFGLKEGSGESVLLLDADNIVRAGFADEVQAKIDKAGFGFAILHQICPNSGLGPGVLFVLLDLIKRALRRPFGKFLVSRQLLNHTGFFDEAIECGENIEFGARLLRNSRKLGLSYERIATPISSGPRRFSRYGYFGTLSKWLLAYLGFYRLSYPSLSDE